MLSDHCISHSGSWATFLVLLLLSREIFCKCHPPLLLIWVGGNEAGRQRWVPCRRLLLTWIFFLFFPLFSGKWVLKEVAIIALFHSQAVAGLGAEGSWKEMPCPHSGSRGCVLGEPQMPQMETLHTRGWQDKWPLANASLLFSCLSLILNKPQT